MTFLRFCSLEQHCNMADYRGDSRHRRRVTCAYLETENYAQILSNVHSSHTVSNRKTIIGHPHYLISCAQILTIALKCSQFSLYSCFLQCFLPATCFRLCFLFKCKYCIIAFGLSCIVSNSRL